MHNIFFNCFPRPQHSKIFLSRYIEYRNIVITNYCMFDTFYLIWNCAYLYSANKKSAEKGTTNWRIYVMSLHLPKMAAKSHQSFYYHHLHSWFWYFLRFWGIWTVFNVAKCIFFINYKIYVLILCVWFQIKWQHIG